MISHSTILLIIVTILSGSCVSIKPTQTEKVVSIGVNNLKQINGFYSNVAENQIEIQSTSLWKQIKFLKKDTITDWKNHKVELEVINGKRVEVKLWLGNTCVSEKLLKGEIRDNYFSVKRQVRVVGVPLICFFTSDNKFAIGVADNNKLIVNRATDRMGMILFMGAGNTEQFTGIYRKE